MTFSCETANINQIPILYIYSLGKCIHVRLYPALPQFWNIQLLVSKSLKMLWMNFSTQIALKSHETWKNFCVIWHWTLTSCLPFILQMRMSFLLDSHVLFCKMTKEQNHHPHPWEGTRSVQTCNYVWVRDREQHKGSPCCRTFHLQIHGPVPLDKGHLCKNTHTQHAHRIHGPSVTMKMEMELNLTQILYPNSHPFQTIEYALKTHFVTVVSSEYIFLLNTPCSLHYCFQQFNKWGLCLKR